MIKLVIDAPGFILKLPGISRQLRTPLTLDITKNNVNNIISYLRGLGISNYKILSTSENTQTVGLDDATLIKTPPRKVVEQPKVIEKHYTLVDNKSEIKTLSKQMSHIQELLAKLNERNKEIGSIYRNDQEEKSNIRTKQKVDSYIPSINTEGMKISTTSKTKTTNDSADDVDYIANLLRSNLSDND